MNTSAGISSFMVLHQLAWEMGWKKVSGEDGKH
jgi:hypothetical protein